VLEMLGRIGDGQIRALRKNLDTPLALREVFQKLEAMSMAERFGYGSKLGEQRLFRPLA